MNVRSNNVATVKESSCQYNVNTVTILPRFLEVYPTSLHVADARRKESQTTKLCIARVESTAARLIAAMKVDIHCHILPESWPDLSKVCDLRRSAISSDSQ